MHPIYALEPFLDRVAPKSVFLAGPTPRSADVPSWRPEALRLLEAGGFTGDVYVPEPRDGKWAEDYTHQIEWEHEGLQKASLILFWIPRNMVTLPGLTTNIEWGMWVGTRKVVLGSPPEAEHMRYIRYQASKLKVPTFDALQDALNHVIKVLG